MVVKGAIDYQVDLHNLVLLLKDQLYKVKTGGITIHMCKGFIKGNFPGNGGTHL